MAASAAVYAPATSADAVASATSLVLSTASLSYGEEQAEMLSVTVASAGDSGTPTGSVTVASGAASVCDITLSASGTGSCALPATGLPAGSAQLTAAYSGDATYAPSASPATAVAISKATTTTALSLSRSTVTYGDEAASKISVSVKGRYSGTPRGSVTVKAGTGTICTITLSSARGACSLASARLAAKSYKISASYAGNADFLSSTTGTKTLAIGRSSSSTALTVSKASVQYGSEQGVKISVTAAGRYSGSLTGTVTVKAGGTTVRVITLKSRTGSYTLTSKQLKAGKYTLVATYNGNGDYTASHSAAKSLTISSPPVKPACHPLTNSGTCYEPGEFCRASDHGAHGIAGDGKAIVCENKNGWRWEPVS
jgi:hypothetical protein